MLPEAPAGLSVAVDLLSPVPPYEQIRQQVGAHVVAGLLTAGDRLPTVRALAARLGLATNTVARAYQELEADGLVTTRRRVGTVVTADRAPSTDPGRAAVVARADELARAAARAGVDEVQVLDLVRGAMLRVRSGGRDRQAHPRPQSVRGGPSSAEGALDPAERARREHPRAEPPR